MNIKKLTIKQNESEQTLPKDLILMAIFATYLVLL
jgi:hypothetical protein